MIFKLVESVNRLDIHSKQPLKIKLTASKAVDILVRPPTDEDRDKGHKSYNAILELIAYFDPKKRARPVFEALLEGRRPPEGEKASSAEELIYREGPSYGLDYYPDPFISFVENVYQDLATAGREVVSVLRWRYAQEGPPSPIGAGSFSVSNDNGNTWHSLPRRYSTRDVTPPHSVLYSEGVDQKEVLNLLESNSQEPISHELLREAKELQHTSRRSSVFIAVAAIEVAVKAVIVKKVSNSEWLVGRIQSPPVVDIITEYFPKLTADEELLYKPTKKEGLVKTILDAVTIRNAMAHKGDPPPKEETLSLILEAAQELLWICDYYSGHTWAIEHINALRFRHKLE